MTKKYRYIFGIDYFKTRKALFASLDRARDDLASEKWMNSRNTPSENLMRAEAQNAQLRRDLYARDKEINKLVVEKAALISAVKLHDIRVDFDVEGIDR